MDHDARIDVPNQGFAEGFFGCEGPYAIIFKLSHQSGTSFSIFIYFSKMFAIASRITQRLNEKSHESLMIIIRHKYRSL
jgi:hypothetical protein